MFLDKKFPKKIIALFGLLIACNFTLCGVAEAGVLFGRRAPGLNTRQSTAAMRQFSQPGNAGGTYGTTKQLAKVVKSRQKAYKKAVKKYEKAKKKAEKLAKKRKKKREKQAKKEAKARKKLLKKQEKERKRQQKLAEQYEEEGGYEDSGSESTSGSSSKSPKSKIVKDNAGDDEKSFFSKLTSTYGRKFSGEDRKNSKKSKKKLDTSKLNWWSKFFLEYFGTI